MQHYIKALRDYCKQDPLNHGDSESVMEFLYWHYAENNFMDDSTIKADFNERYQLMNGMSLREMDKIIGSGFV